MSNYCIVCDSTQTVSMYTGIVKCKDCGYVYANLDMTQDEFEGLYNSGYFKGEEYSDYLADKSISQRNFNARLKVLNKYINPEQHKSLLEVGCAYGFFLELAEKSFNHVAGVDVTSEGVEYARNQLNLNAYQADLLNWDFEQRRFDVACLWDTIEHLRAPDKYLEKISTKLSPGGLLAVTTGDIESRMARWRKNRWRLIHPPTHAHYFSHNSLKALLDRYGFDIINFEYCNFYRSMDNVAYNILVLRSNFSWLYKLLKKLKLLNWGFSINMFDIMYIIARKR
ncbi:class I SAM-dependent methyltransferase [Candidatus Pseudothioglobus singularis]|nr:class I SAM-dependent methyltransferase [Candidatus Pseudothioglobus singularis]